LYTVVKFYVFKPTNLQQPEKESVRIYSPDETETDPDPDDEKKTR
jgi:hypothetical protein